MSKIEDAPERMLRAWADAGVISSARYVEEMERRRAAASTIANVIANTPHRVLQAPPLDFALDRELDVPGLAILDFEGDDEDAVPNPAPGAWLVGFFLATVAIAAVLIWRSLP